MAAKRKAEGIALLSLYNDDDEEEMDEDTEENQQKTTLDINNSSSNETPNNSVSPSPLTTGTPMEEDDDERPPSVYRDDNRERGLGIVDYAHDEMAVSPDQPEDGEITGADVQLVDGDHISKGTTQGKTSPRTVQVLTPGSIVTSQPDTVGEAPPKLESELQSSDISMSKEPTALQSPHLNGETKNDSAEQEEDALAEFFIHPPPTVKCSEELQNKINKYLSLKNAGRSFNEELRKSKGYRNPDFLQRAVKYQEINQTGSCLRKEVFDPDGYDPSDYYDALATELKKEFERREQEKKKNQKVDFVHGGVQAASVPSIKAVPQVVAGQKATSVTNTNAALPPLSTSGDNLKSDSRQNKKSKWDKVDGDRRNTMPAGSKDAMAAASAQAALLSAANAGAGYSAFAQQKRREAEERKTTDRRSDKHH